MPHIISNKCISCNKCVSDCPSDAINLSEFSISDKCIDCGHCAAICPVQAIEMNGEIPVILNELPKFEEVESLMAGLRSVRHFRDKEVSKELIEQIISTIKHAPSASNERMLEITVISNSDKIRALDEATTDVMRKVFKRLINPVVRPIMRMVAGSKALNSLVAYKETFNRRMKDKCNIYSHSAPVVILIHAKKKIGSMYTDDANIWATYLTFAARSLGLGTCFIGFYVNAFNLNKKLNKQFKIPKNHKIEAALVLGHPNVQYKNETGRKVPVTNWG